VTDMTDPKPAEPAGYDDPTTSGGDPADGDLAAGTASEDSPPMPGTTAPWDGGFRAQAVPFSPSAGAPPDIPRSRLSRTLRRLFTISDRNAN